MRGDRIERILTQCEITSQFFKGVYAADTVERPLSYPAALVANLDVQDEKGTHWVAIYCPSPAKAIYFDSYGLMPEGNIGEFVKQFPQKEAHEAVIQSVISDVCAHYCIYFLYMCCAGYSFVDLLYILGREENMDVFVHSFVECIE